MSSNNKNTKFIGATTEDVRAAIRRGEIRYATHRAFERNVDGWDPIDMNRIDLRGVGTRRLTQKLALALARRWWKAGPGAKVAVGFVHSDSFLLNNPDDPDGRRNPEAAYRPEHIKVVTVTRPQDRELKQWESEYGYPVYEFAQVFQTYLLEAVRQMNKRTLFVGNRDTTYGGHFWGMPWHTAFLGPNRKQVHKHSYYFVWPNGIIKNARTSNALNKLHQGIDKRNFETAYRMRKKMNERWMDTYPYDPSNNIFGGRANSTRDTPRLYDALKKIESNNGHSNNKKSRLRKTRAAYVMKRQRVDPLRTAFARNSLKKWKKPGARHSYNEGLPDEIINRIMKRVERNQER